MREKTAKFIEYGRQRVYTYMYVRIRTGVRECPKGCRSGERLFRVYSAATSRTLNGRVPTESTARTGREKIMVENINGLTGLGGVQPARRMKAAYRMSEVPSPADTVEITSDVMRLRGVEGVRLDRVMAVKSEIAAGNYFTAEKLDIALDRALDQLFGG